MKEFFIIGLRRSGTSFLKRELDQVPEIGKIDFEPHALWYAVMLQKFNRFKDPFYSKIIENFHKRALHRWQGAKFALNPGIDALDWKSFIRFFPECKVIFTIRNIKDTYASYYKCDKDIIRGAVPFSVYEPMYVELTRTFEQFTKENPNKACIWYYDEIFKDPVTEFNKISKLLGISKPKGTVSRIKKPEHWSA